MHKADDSDAVKTLEESIDQSAQDYAEAPLKMIQNNSMEFSVETLQPKVPAQNPLREIMPDFSNHKVVQSLEDLGVTPFQMLPSSFFIKQDYRKKTSNVLPLGWFDNDITDPLETNGWILKMNIIGENYQLLAEAFLPVPKMPSRQYLTKDNVYKFYSWRKVAVISYSASTQLWLVKDFNLNLEYNLSRIYIRFLAEDPAVFAARIKEAVKFQEKTENHLKFQMIVDSATFHEFPVPRIDTHNAIKSLMYNRQLNLHPWWRELIENEHVIMYQKFLFAADLKHSLKNNPEDYSFIEVFRDGN